MYQQKIWIMNYFIFSILSYWSPIYLNQNVKTQQQLHEFNEEQQVKLLFLYIK